MQKQLKLKLQKNKLTKNLAGFSLMEIMVSIAIIAILSLVMVANFHSFSKKTALDSFMSNLEADMKLVRAKSSAFAKDNNNTSNSSWGISFDFANRKYIIYADSNLDKMYTSGEEVKTVSFSSNIMIEGSPSYYDVLFRPINDLDMSFLTTLNYSLMVYLNNNSMQESSIIDTSFVFKDLESNLTKTLKISGFGGVWLE